MFVHREATKSIQSQVGEAIMVVFPRVPSPIRPTGIMEPTVQDGGSTGEGPTVVAGTLWVLHVLNLVQQRQVWKALWCQV